MAEVTKNVLKGYFTKGSVPTQSNYADLVDTMVSQSEMNTAISGVNSSVGNATSDIAKIAEILGKGQNETLTQLAAKFAALTGNYANVYAFVSKVKAFLEDTDATDATINRWQEIESFLSGITDSDSLTAMLADLKSEIEGNLAVDSALSATSEHALQNKVLYDELRMTDGGATTINTIASVTNDDGTELEFTRLDANTLQTAEVNGQLVYVIPFVGTRTTGVYNAPIIAVVNASGKVFVFSNVDNVYGGYGFYGFDSGANTKFFDGTSVVNVDFTEYASEDYSRGFASFTENSASNITGTSYYYFGGDDALGRSVELNAHYGNVTIDGTVIKSLKTKIAELEARLAAVPTNYLEFATDMSAYASAAAGKVLLYLGATTQDFTHGYVYEKTASGWNNLSVSPVIN